MEQVIKELLELKDRISSIILRLQDDLPELTEGDGSVRQISWGKRVSPQFKAGVIWIEEQLGLKADDLMNCMAFETGQTFSPSIKNLAGSSGLGLIQFMSFTHKNMLEKYPQLAKLAPKHSDLAKLSAVEQLSFVYWYFRAFGQDLSAWDLDDIYMAILYPKAIGKPSDWIMPWKYGSLAYKQNSGLDLNKDKKITKAEACAGVRRMATLGQYERG